MYTYIYVYTNYTLGMACDFGSPARAWVCTGQSGCIITCIYIHAYIYTHWLCRCFGQPSMCVSPSAGKADSSTANPGLATNGVRVGIILTGFTSFAQLLTFLPGKAYLFHFCMYVKVCMGLLLSRQSWASVYVFNSDCLTKNLLYTHTHAYLCVYIHIYDCHITDVTRTHAPVV